MEIWSRVSMRMDLWERGLHKILVGDAEAEGTSHEGRATRGGEEEEDSF